jgi:hypothetical protein
VLVDAVTELAHRLARVVESLELQGQKFGRPEFVEKPAREAEVLFKKYSSANPSPNDALAAASAFLRGKALDVRQRHLIASVLAAKVPECGGRPLLGHPRFKDLLRTYEEEAASGDLWRLTWYGLLSAYFGFDVRNASEQDQAGWQELQTLLHNTWPAIDRACGTGAVPDWISVLRRESQLLTHNAAAKYASDYLDGNTEEVDQLSSDLGISESSWFWQALVMEVVRYAAVQDDQQFFGHIPDLIQLIEARPVYRDEAIEWILERYHRMNDPAVHEQLRDYVVRKDVWQNPKLKMSGIATAWHRVPEHVWRMVLAWVNEGNLRDFFAILAARNNADEGRLAFWSKYIKQISWTRLIFGSDTLALARKHEDIRDLIAREEGAYAKLTVNRDVDAFMMQIGEYIIVEFSKTGNACFLCPAEELSFDRYARRYAGNGTDLKGGGAKFTHHRGWESEVARALKHRGIQPDAKGGAQRPSASPSFQRSARIGAKSLRPDRSAPAGAPFTMEELESLVSRYPSASIKDSRSKSGGRLWVEGGLNDRGVWQKLEAFGFVWSQKRPGWYFPES